MDQKTGGLHAGIVDGQHVVIYDAAGVGLAEMIVYGLDKKRAAATAIVDAVNSLPGVTAERDALLAVCRRLDEIDCCDGYELTAEGYRILWDALNMARAAISQAGIR